MTVLVSRNSGAFCEFISVTQFVAVLSQMSIWKSELIVFFVIDGAEKTTGTAEVESTYPDYVNVLSQVVCHMNTSVQSHVHGRIPTPTADFIGVDWEVSGFAIEDDGVVTKKFNDIVLVSNGDRFKFSFFKICDDAEVSIFEILGEEV